MLPTTQTILSVSAGLSLLFDFALAGPARLPRDTSLHKRKGIKFKAPSAKGSGGSGGDAGSSVLDLIFGPTQASTTEGNQYKVTVELWNSLDKDEMEDKFGYKRSDMAFLDLTDSASRTAGAWAGTGSATDPEYSYVKKFGDAMVDGVKTPVVDILVASEGKMVEAVYKTQKTTANPWSYTLGDRLELIACNVWDDEDIIGSTEAKCKVIHRAEPEKVAETELDRDGYTENYEAVKDEEKNVWAEAVPAA